MTGHAFGRDDQAGRWMPKWPMATMTAFALSFVVCGVATYVVVTVLWTPAQRSYLKAYTRSSVLAHMGVSRHAPVRDALRTHVYGGWTLTRLAVPVWLAGGLTLGLALLVAIPRDRRRIRQRQHGRRLKGPELVDAKAFSRRLKADGIVFHQAGRALPVAIPRSLESSHILQAGDTGTGKSTLIADVLKQIAQRDETAVVYDPAMDYVRTFYRPERGDVILNPVDARCPYWKPGDEVLSDVEALTLATALFPPRPHETNTFFTESSRGIFAFLLTFRPTAQQLVTWLTDGNQLDRLLKGTVHEAILDRDAPAQRSGVMASLNLVADTLQLCPSEAAGVGRWSAADWARRRTGWVFITSTPETRARLMPLHTLWLDMLILRLMSEPANRKAWLIVDELATLNRLPQLHTAVTEGRKSNLALVIGFQGRSQMEARYGRDAETMLSQPATKILLRASEPKSAEWASKVIGDIETERMKQSRQDGWTRLANTTYGLERHVEPLVMPSEISGLPNLSGYIKVGNLVSRMQFPYTARPVVHPGLVRRPVVAPRQVPALSILPPLPTELGVN